MAQFVLFSIMGHCYHRLILSFQAADLNDNFSLWFGPWNLTPSNPTLTHYIGGDQIPWPDPNQVEILAELEFLLQLQILPTSNWQLSCLFFLHSGLATASCFAFGSVSVLRWPSSDRNAVSLYFALLPWWLLFSTASLYHWGYWSFDALRFLAFKLQTKLSMSFKTVGSFLLDYTAIFVNETGFTSLSVFTDRISWTCAVQAGSYTAEDLMIQPNGQQGRLHDVAPWLK